MIIRKNSYSGVECWSVGDPRSLIWADHRCRHHSESWSMQYIKSRNWIGQVFIGDACWCRFGNRSNSINWATNI